MNKILKFTSLLLVCTLMIAMQPIKAFNYNPHTITIKSENFGHTFEAYQIFKGDLSDGLLTNVEWGLSIVDGEGLLSELKTLPNYFECNSAADVAKVLGNLNTATAADEFAKVVAKYMHDIPVGSINGGIPNEEGCYYYKISVSGDGYYLVKDRDNSVTGNDAYTKYILEVVGDVEVVAKSDYPTLDKQIVSTNSDYNVMSIGDTVEFALTTSVPKMDGYNQYYFIIQDEMSEGLTFNNDVVVTLDGVELDENKYEVKVNGQTFEVIFDDFIQYNEANVDDEIIVTYSAILDEDALSGKKGNDNAASLTYSNNPNVNYQGENQPLTGESVGVTPSSMTYTYTGNLVITKVDGNNDQLLSGAKFKITGDNLKKVQVTEDVYTISPNGNYYRLNDGSYTKAQPTDSTKSLYASTTSKYECTYQTKFVDVANGEEAIGVVDESGTLTFRGLAAGTYTITEIEAPNGYNKLDNPIEVEIGFRAPTTGTECDWSINGDFSVSGLTVKNYSGTTLPSTGGMGTTIFYALGAILIGSSSLVLLGKKEKEENEG